MASNKSVIKKMYKNVYIEALKSFKRLKTFFLYKKKLNIFSHVFKIVIEFTLFTQYIVEVILVCQEISFKF